VNAFYQIQKKEMHKFFDDVCHRVAKREIPRAANLLKSIR
jgi:hypothetical protein